MMSEVRILVSTRAFRCIRQPTSGIEGGLSQGRRSITHVVVSSCVPPEPHVSLARAGGLAIFGGSSQRADVSFSQPDGTDHVWENQACLSLLRPCMRTSVLSVSYVTIGISARAHEIPIRCSRVAASIHL